MSVPWAETGGPQWNLGWGTGFDTRRLVLDRLADARPWRPPERSSWTKLAGILGLSFATTLPRKLFYFFFLGGTLLGDRIAGLALAL